MMNAKLLLTGGTASPIIMSVLHSNAMLQLLIVNITQRQTCEATNQKPVSLIQEWIPFQKHKPVYW